MLLLLLAGTQSGSCFYNPHPGRWLSRDPIGEESFLSSDATEYIRLKRLRLRVENLKHSYLFVANNSANHSDAHGLWGETWIGLEPYIVKQCFNCFHPLDHNDTQESNDAGYQLANDSYPFDSPEHEAMRHCVALAVLAMRIGCSTAECYGTARERWQTANGFQGSRDGQQAINNNRLGRRCAGCVNADATTNPGGQRANPPPRASLEAIGDCCREAINSGEADLGDPRE